MCTFHGRKRDPRGFYPATRARSTSRRFAVRWQCVCMPRCFVRISYGGYKNSVTGNENNIEFALQLRRCVQTVAGNRRNDGENTIILRSA